MRNLLKEYWCIEHHSWQPYIGVQYALNNISFVLNEADENFRIIMFALAYKDLVCFIRQARVDNMTCSYQYRATLSHTVETMDN